MEMQDKKMWDRKMQNWKMQVVKYKNKDIYASLPGTYYYGQQYFLVSILSITVPIGDNTDRETLRDNEQCADYHGFFCRASSADVVTRMGNGRLLSLK